MPTNKTLVIGLDGATPNLIYPLARKGIFKNLQDIISAGVHGNLKSTIPPVTCPAWVSSVTGVNPGKHGIYDFLLSVDLRKKKIEYANSTKRKTKAIWNMLIDSGMNVIVLNVPVTYPPEKVNGVIVTGMLTPSLRSEFTYPKELKEDLLDLNYQIDIGETMLEKIISFKRGKIQMLKEVEALVESRLRAAQFLMMEYEWDFFMVVFVALDRIQHLFWRYIDSKHIAYNPIESNSIFPHIVRVFRRLDMGIGKLVKEAGKNTNIVIYSDHGFKPLNTFFFPNNVLRKKRFLKLSEKRLHHLSIVTQTNVQKTLINFHLDKLLQKIPVNIRRHIGKIIPPSIDFSSIFEVTPNDTKAFYIGDGFIKINRDCVEGEKEYEKIRNKIIQLFSGESIHTSIKVHLKEQIYKGPQIGSIPEIILENNESIGLSSLMPLNGTEFLDYRVDNEKPSLMWNGQHDRHGIIICKGPDFKNNKIIDADILDITPTILRTFGYTIPPYLDGRALFEALRDITWG